MAFKMCEYKCIAAKINKMQANPDKFQVLAVGKKTYEKRLQL